MSSKMDVILEPVVTVKVEEDPAAADVKQDDLDDEVEDEISTIASDVGSESETEIEGDIEITEDFTDKTVDLKETIKRFPAKYENIIAEFADVEIFLISIDGLIIELTAHSYLEWNFGGQTVVIAKQIDRFLTQLSSLGGKFKLIWFTDLEAVYALDNVLNFLRSFVSAYLALSIWAKDVVYFKSPVDENWSKYIFGLTPSFLMISTNDVYEKVSSQQLNFGLLFTSIALHTLAAAIPIVHFNGLVINLCSVFCHRIEPAIVHFTGWEERLNTLWNFKHQPIIRKSNLKNFKSMSELWAVIIDKCKRKGKLGKNFDSLASAVLIASLVSERRGTDRIYIPERPQAKRGMSCIQWRRELLSECSKLLDSIDFTTSISEKQVEEKNADKKKSGKFDISDLWDGRLIIGIFDEINAQKKVPILPYRIQRDFAQLHKLAGLELSLEVDQSDRLFEPLPENDLILNKCELLPVKNLLLHRYANEYEKQIEEKCVDKERLTFALFEKGAEWPFHPIQENYIKPGEKLDDHYQLKKKNRQRQFLSRWYEVFAQSLEGRGSNLLVDFSRTPRGFAVAEEDDTEGKKKEKPQWQKQQKGKEEDDTEGKKKEKQQWPKQQKGKGGKGKKEPAKSKKELILEMNKSKKNEKQVETEKQMIKFATMQGAFAVNLLENLMEKLELEESRACCVYEQAVRVARSIDSLEGSSLLEARRLQGVAVVDKIKQLFTQHWDYLDDRQKDFITDLWVSLGFEKNKKRTLQLEGRLTLKMNMVYYQLAYGGELIDIQSDPQKDDRVTGFHPDAWQRNMLDAVDKNLSAVVIAPTSAGKTFVSYYCIEKVLRQSDDDMVVYVSPSKALVNQVCGSVYARFRNKTLSGGKSLFGTLFQDYCENALNCQVLVTVPECFESILMSNNPEVQLLVSKIKYVIFDEVHCISASPEAQIWEHLLLLIRCPFLALSATIGNADDLHHWLQEAEKSKFEAEKSKVEAEKSKVEAEKSKVEAEKSKVAKGGHPRKVELIRYSERYSELEICLQRIKDEDPDATLNDQSNSVLEHFMPYGVYNPVKLEMFRIPDDQQLTARQILDFYYALAEVDPEVKAKFEPCAFFNYKEDGEKVWLSRADIRRLENGLKARLLEWLDNKADKASQSKVENVLNKLGQNVSKELEYRSRPFDQRATALKNIVPVIMDLRDKGCLPAICFNDDRRICERLADRLFEYLEEQQKEFEASAEFKSKYEIKDEEKLMKLAKRKRDAKEKAKSTKPKKMDKMDKRDRDERERDEVEPDVDEGDPLAAQRIRLQEVLERFKFRGRHRDEELYTKMIERMQHSGGRNRESTKRLLKLFERGIGFHHQGLNASERGAVEVLFRSGHLAIVFSTSTLALGINMPCKTVLFGIDTPQLTPLQFRQMSGRAGRRGFDRSGNVIFVSVPTAKIRRLLTASLSTLRGNLPFTASFVLRLFSLTSVKNDNAGQQIIQKGAMSSFEIRVQIALTLLENSFVLYTRSSMKQPLQKEIKLFTLFSVQLLRWLDLLDKDGDPKGLASVVCYLSAHEPGNLLFAHLLQNGIFHLLCKTLRENKEELKSLLIFIFAHLFTNRRLPLGWEPDGNRTTTGSRVFLESLKELTKRKIGKEEKTGDLGSKLVSLIEMYNEKVDTLFKAFMQLTGPRNSLQGNIFSIAGKPDSSVCGLSGDIVRPLHDDFLFDEGLLPAHAIDPTDHRGNKVYLNAYAVDFWHLKSKKALERDNNIDVRETWLLIHEFSITLDKIKEALLAVGRPKDPFVEVMRDIAEEFSKKFYVAFGMKERRPNY